MVLMVLSITGYGHKPYSITAVKAPYAFVRGEPL